MFGTSFGTTNSSFWGMSAHNLGTWRESVHRVAEATRTALAQATVRIIFRDVDDDLLEG